MSHEDVCHAVEQWLIKNNYTACTYKAAYEKFLCVPVPGKSMARTLHSISFFDIVSDPISVVRDVEKQHQMVNLFFRAWNWDADETTRKIDISDPSKDNKVDQTWCSHEWVDYLGLNEKFKYCKKCDKKKD